MLYNRCAGIYKFGNNNYPRRIRSRSNLGHIFRDKKCVLWAGKYGYSFTENNRKSVAQKQVLISLLRN